MRSATLERKTRETEIRLNLVLDGEGKSNIQTGNPFFDHMLDHVAFHGLFNLELAAQGDLDIDAHHTIEDCALLLGQAFDQALDSRSSIYRYGHAYVPMDESLARVVVDFSGRPYWAINIGWSSPTVAGIPCSLIEHFFQSFAVTARCTLHLATMYGNDNHHLSEASFKAFGRALRQAVSLDEKRGSQIPSTKGTLTG